MLNSHLHFLNDFFTEAVNWLAPFSSSLLKKGSRNQNHREELLKNYKGQAALSDMTINPVLQVIIKGKLKIG